ncbi:MAG: hypothetical protein HYU61_05340, partial [Brevundimonas diminuta]|nr:hypothetical protein [Brevundimonas diminuta]
MIFDAEGRPMSPAFSYGRGGRAYRYYVSAPLQKGASVHVDDTLRRVPGHAADELVIDAVSRLTRAETNPACLSQHLRRVELHADCVHLVLKRPGPAGQTRDAQTDIAAIERRLAPGERLLVEETDPALVRVVLPVRLKLRGGRSWMALPDGKSGARKA